ncbi:immunoglobulin domain-containing protein, partial [Flavobacterium sp. LAR06]|uniref:immunoglobulin domain-containing protein n=1 Tax=Flavobacterium sp. LAR06 TaxID=3064897 RepID=UPI0035C25F21
MGKKYLFLIIAFLLLLTSSSSLAQAPGGVSSNLKFWLKADAGVTGTNVSAWADQSGNAINFTQAVASSQPLLVNNSINNNPAVRFTNDVMNFANGITGVGSISDVNIYSVIRINNSAGNATLVNQAIPGGSLSIFLPFSTNGNVYWRPKAPDLIFSFASIPNNKEPHMYSFNASITAGQTHGGTVKNAIVSDGKVLASGVTMTSFTGGASNATLGNSMANDDIAEVIGYLGPVNAVQNNQIQSYLALKYGITLDQTVAKNYVNSSGVAWYPSATSHSGFAKDVTGIAKDDGSGLNQTNSRSVNIGSVLSIESPAALNNDDYFITGDNGVSIDLRSTDVPAGGYGKRLQRVWRVSKSGVGAVNLKFDLNLIPELLLSTANLSNIALLVNNSNSFATSTPYTGSISGSTLEFTGITLNNGDYFTLNIGEQIIPTTYDFEFWFGVPSWNTTYFMPQKLHFTGVSDTQSAAYVIDMPADPSFTPITGFIAPTTAKIIDMSSLINSITVKPANTIQNKGLRIRVNGQMGAYYANESDSNYGTMPLRGPNALGTSFIIPGQDTFSNSQSWGLARSMFVVTSTQDNTIVTINPTEAILGHGANVPFTITLNKGQSYSAEATSSTGRHMAGSLVTSTKPVVVTYMDDLLGYGSAADNMGDQLVPIAKLGLEYVHLRANLNNNGELAYIFGSEDGTTITIFDGTTTSTLVVNKGGMVKHLMPVGKNAASIIADKPIMVYKIGGYATELGGGVLTPIAECKGTRAIAFQYPTVATEAVFNFVAPNSILSGFSLNGDTTLLQASDFTAIPNMPGWSYCRKTVTNTFSPGDVVSIKNTLGKFYFYQNMYSNGGGDYSNFSDFGNVVLFPETTHTCETNTITLNNGAIAFNSNITGYSWTGPNGFSSTQASPVLTDPTALNTGTYLLTVTDNTGCSHIENLIVDLPISSIVVTPMPSAPCVGSTVTFTSETVPAGAVPASISWTGPNGFTSTQAEFEITDIKAAQAGTYTCTYTDKYGCTVTNSTTITVSPSVLSSFAIGTGGIKRLNCNNPSITLNVAGFTPGLRYDTFNPYDASSLFASSDFTVIANGFYNEEPATSGIASQMNLTGLSGITTSSVSYGVQYRGFINITTAGDYIFYTNSHDGSNLYIDGSLRVSNDGGHTLTEVASTAFNLSVGRHAIVVNYFQSAVGADALTVSYSGPSIAKQAIPASVLSHAEGTAPTLTYNWSTGETNTSSITVTTPGIYTVTGSNGGCSSVASFEITAIDNYDYSDIIAPWPVAQARVANCLVAGVPTGSNTSVWAGAGISLESIPLRNATASADAFDDGLIRPTGAAQTATSQTFNVILNTNTPGTMVHYGMWFDWNNNGNFADDVDANGDPAFYSGNSAVGASAVILPVAILAPSGVTAYKLRLIVADIPVVFTAFDDIFDNGEVEDYTSILLLEGTVFGDRDGLGGSPVNTVNGTGTNAGGLNAILVNSLGRVVAVTPVPVNGHYSFVSIDQGTYSIVLSAANAVVGATPPSPSLPAGWANTGENLGATAGNDGDVNGILPNIVISTANVAHANFGINGRPTADTINSCEVDPGGTNQIIVPALTGVDFEDGIYDGSTNNNTITIVTLPANGVLYYSGLPVTAGQVISNYNKSLLTIDPNAGVSTLSFTFSVVDGLGAVSLPATVTLSTTYAGIDQSAFVGGNTTMAATGTGTWTPQIGNPGTATITTPSSPFTTITAFSTPGTYNFIWTSLSGCVDIASVVVTTSMINGVDDNYTSVPINGATGGTTASVLQNDTLNGVILNPADIILTPVTVPAGLTLNPNGTITVSANTPAGTYVLTYSICEKLNSGNCDGTTTATIEVIAVGISGVVHDDANGLIGTPFSTVDGIGTNAGGLTAILVNNVGDVVANSAVAIDGSYNFTLLPPGTYSVVLSTTAAIVGTPAPSSSLPSGWANTGEYLGTGSGNDGTVNGVLTNIVLGAATSVVNADFGINSIPIANPLTACITDAGGSTQINVPVLTGSDFEDGTYTGSSSTNTITIVSLPVNGTLFYNSIAVTAGQVISNYNPNLLTVDPGAGVSSIVFNFNEVDAAGMASLPAQIILNISDAGPDQNVFLNGTATMAATGVGTWSILGTPPGAAIITDINNPTTTITGFDTNGTYVFVWTTTANCSDRVQINVPGAQPIVANNDTGNSIAGISGGISFSNVLLNDTLGGNPATTGNVMVSFVNSTHPGITLSGTDVFVAAGTPAGNYLLTYQICEAVNSGNCDTATVTVNVTAPVINAVIDNFTSASISGTTGGSTPSVLLNDMLNGAILNPSDITLTPVTVPAGLTLNADGTLTVAPNTTGGTYVVTYSICENLNPTNCSTTTATLFVAVPNITIVKGAVFNDVNGDGFAQAGETIT